MEDHVKGKILEAWNRLGETFLSELSALFQQKAAPPAPVQQVDTGSKREPPTKAQRNAARRRLTKKSARKVSSNSSPHVSSRSSSEETYQPPPANRKQRSPSPEESLPVSEEKPPQIVEPVTSSHSEQGNMQVEEAKRGDEEDIGLDSSSSSSSPESSPQPELQVEADPYAGLTFSAETLIRLNSDLTEAKDDPAKVKHILDILDSLITSYSGDFVPVLRETNILRDMRKSTPTFPPETRTLCSDFMTRMKTRVNEKPAGETKDDSEEWKKLEKQLAEKMKRKSDTEILAVMRRIDEIIPDKTNSESQKEIMRPCFHLVKQVSHESKHTEVQRKAAALYKRWRGLHEQSDTTDEPGKRIALDREKIRGKLSGYYEEARDITVAERSGQKTTKTISATHLVGVNKKKT